MTEDEDREKEAMTKDGNRIVILFRDDALQRVYLRYRRWAQDRSCTPHSAKTPSVGQWALTLVSSRTGQPP
jgi:hypothetical protein